MTMNSDISEQDRKTISEELSKLLADSYTLYLKTHNYHWNVTGPSFQQLHAMFELQYQELALAVDLIAERIRALGLPAPASYIQFTKLTSVKEEEQAPSAQGMLQNLVTAHETVIQTARSVLAAARKANDAGTEDVATQRIQIHEKTAWMLRSSLG